MKARTRGALLLGAGRDVALESAVEWIRNRSSNWAAGPVKVVADPGDFRTIDGVRMAFSSRMAAMGQQRVLTVDKVEHNVNLPADRFASPAEIKALIEK